MSGSVTLGGFAKNWRISRVGYAYSIQLGKMLQPERQFENDGEVPYLKSQHVQAGVIFSEDLPLMWANLAEISKYGVRDGDLLVCEGGDVGRAAMAVQVPEDTIIQNALHRVRSSGGNSLSYLLYVLLHIKNHGWFDIICNKSTIAHLTREKLSALAIPLPPPLVQQSITAHLDRETAKIDTLIAKKRELIAKLKEQRSALISRTVTRGLPPEAAQAAGLDPHPQMKDSGVEWIGEVPAHWVVKPLKFVASIGNGSTPARDNDGFWEGGYFPWLNSSVVNLEEVIEGVDFVTNLALKECHLPRIAPPAVLIGITGEGRTRGMATTLKIEATINQHIAFVKPVLAKIDIDFVRRLLDKAYLHLRAESDGGGSSKGAITCEQIGNLYIAIPPLREQFLIAFYLQAETARIERLVGLVQTAITRLTEYRAALITAAVTGQVYVR